MFMVVFNYDPLKRVNASTNPNYLDRFKARCLPRRSFSEGGIPETKRTTERIASRTAR
jgi:hypothetical protein